MCDILYSPCIKVHFLKQQKCSDLNHLKMMGQLWKRPLKDAVSVHVAVCYNHPNQDPMRG